MRSIGAVVLVAALVAACGPSPRFGGLAFGARKFSLSTPGQTTELRSGVVIAPAQDVRTNLVSVDVRYKVGAAEDPPGRAGLAHLVEHLMFELREEDTSPSVKAELGDAALVYNAYTNHD